MTSLLMYLTSTKTNEWWKLQKISKKARLNIKKGLKNIASKSVIGNSSEKLGLLVVKQLLWCTFNQGAECVRDLH